MALMSKNNILQIPLKTAPQPPAMHVETAMVTPTQAADWLKLNHPRNRKVSDKKVQRFAALMKAGLWRHTHQGIAFDTDGLLFDGQHRLHAICQSGLTVPVTVAYDVPKDALKVVDSHGTNRKFDEYLRMVEDVEVSKNAVAIATRMYYGLRTVNEARPYDDQAEWFLDHKAAILWAEARSRKHSNGAIHDAATFGAIASAYYFCQQKGKLTQLSRIAEILQEGRGSGPDRDEMIVKLRNRLAEMRRSSNGDRSECYKLTAQAIYDYIFNPEYSGTAKHAKDPLKYRPKAAKEELFAIPGGRPGLD